MSTDWAYHVEGIRNPFLFELRDEGNYAFMAPPRMIRGAAEDLWLGMHSILTDLTLDLDPESASTYQNGTEV